MNLRRFIDSLGLKWRLILGVSSLLLISSLLLSTFLIGEFSNSAIEELQRRGASLAKNLAYNAEFGVLLENAHELSALVAGMLNDRDVLFAEIYTKDGTRLSRSVRKDIDSADFCFKDNREGMDHLTSRRGEDVTFWNCQLLNGTDYIEFLSPVRSLTAQVSKEELGYTVPSQEKPGNASAVIGYVHVGIGLHDTEQKIKATTQMIVFFTALLVMLGILLSVTLVKMIASPINTLVDVTERIASGDLTQRVHVETDAELERLALAFNTMCDSLEKTRRELEVHNLNLEEMVRERTRKLEEVQRQVIQSEKMAAVGQLAAGVAHELNNPLGGILGYAQFALEKVASDEANDKDASDLSRYLADIESQARRCKMIVKNLLKFSRASDRVEFEMIDLNAALEETFVFTSHQLDMKDIRLIKDLHSDLPKVLGNVNLLQQVFTNILINSMQSMPDGGDLLVKTWYEPPVGEFGGSVSVMFRDNGTGIPEEYRTKIFEPFFTTKKVGEGTGLGLSVSYGIVKEHGGDIKVESAIGSGSTFTVVLPIVKEMAQIAT